MKHANCDFALESVQKVSESISDALINEVPFSLIRLGDGEGLLLSISSESPEVDFAYLAEHLGDYGVDIDDLLHLKSRLIQSIKGADFIGVRDDIVDVIFRPDSFALSQNDFLERFRKSFRLREAEKSLEYDGSRRIAFLHKHLSEIDFRENNQFCSAWFQYDYHSSGEIFEVLKQQQRVGIISCRTQLPALLREKLGVSVKFHEIPDMFRDLTSEEKSPGYIEKHEDILNRQLVEFPGMLYLVGGGFYGKLYCELIKSQGGVAIDVGSLLDAWLGIPSRPTVYKSKFDASDALSGVPPGLLLTRTSIDCLLPKP